MNKDVVETLLIIGGLLWLVYKWFWVKMDSAKKQRVLFTGVFLLCFLPSRWPFFLPMQVSFSLWSFAAAASLIIEHYVKKRKEYGLAYFYIVFFIGFGLIFLIQGISEFFKSHPS